MTIKKILTANKITLLFIVVLLSISWMLGLSKDPQAKVEVSLAPDVLFFFGNIPDYEHVLVGNIFIDCFGCLGFAIAFWSQTIPTGFQNIAEALIGGGFDFLNSITNNRKKTRRMFPFIFTMFVFILFANLFTYLPGNSAVTLSGKPLFRAVMSDYGLTFLLILTGSIVMQITAIVVNGPIGYIKKFINFSSPIGFLLGLMEIVGELAKIISISFRLFGNLFAGEVLGMVMLFLMPFFLPLPFMVMGLLTAVVQAFVFSLLTAIFITIASESAHVPEETTSTS